MARRVSLAMGLVAIALALVLALAQTGERRSGTDLTPNGAYVLVLKPGQAACQGLELTPSDTAAVRMTIATYGAPAQPLSVSTVDAQGRPVTQGRLGTAWTQGVVRIPVARVARASAGDRFCIRNDGHRAVAIAGDAPDPGFQMTLAGRTLANVRMRVDYMRPGDESWFQVAPAIAHRFSLGKAPWLRHWAWAAYLLLVLGAIACAAALLLAPGAEPRR